MSEEPEIPDLVELTRHVFDAADRRDFDAVGAAFAPDAVWESHVIEATFEGRAAIREFFERWWAAYDAFDVQAEDISEFGNGVVLCVFHNDSRAPDGEREPGLRFAMVILWSDGVVARVIGEEDIDAARTAAERLAAERA